MEFFYIVMFLSLWTMGAVLLFYNLRKNVWIAMTVITSGLGSFAVSVHLSIMPYILPLDILSPFWSTAIYRISVTAMTIYFYFFPYAGFMGGLWLGALRTFRGRMLLSLGMALPTVWLYAEHVLREPWNYFAVSGFRWWSGCCILLGSVMYVLAVYREKDMYAKRSKRRVAFLFTSGILWGFTADFIGFRSLTMKEWSFELESNGLWHLNVIIVLGLVVAVLIYTLKYGFLGIKFKIEREKLDSSMRALTMGVSILNHSIKNEIQKINYLTEKTQGYIESGHRDKSLQSLVQIHAVSAHLLGMVGRIKEKADDIALKEERISIEGLQAAALTSMLPIIEERSIKVDLRQETGGELLCDAMHLKETLSNLIHNAVDAMTSGEGGGTLTLRAFRTKKFFVFEVKDSGCGIPKEQLNRIFEPFYTTKKNSRNYGLGLSYCISVMRKHGGNLVIADTEPGKGTSIWLQFPIRRFKDMPQTPGRNAARGLSERPPPGPTAL